MKNQRPLVLAITGASGAPYGVRLLEALLALEQRVWLIVSAHGLRLLEAECGIGSLEAWGAKCGERWERLVTVFDDRDRGALPASGSVPTAGMVICPCSMGTVAAVALGTSRSLVERAADVTLKERRRLVVVPRETPLSEVHLENLLRLARLGVQVIPAMPGFYHRPSRVDELVDFVVARVLDHLGLEHSLGRRWSGSHRDSD